MNFADTIGSIAGTLTTISFLPQALKVWKTKSCEDISTTMCIILTSAAALWAVYGILMGARPIFLSNIIMFSLVSYILLVKFKTSRPKRFEP